MVRILVFSLSLLCFAPTLHADDFSAFKSTVKIFIDASGFYWDETMGSEKLLDETGVLYGTGVSFKGIGRKPLDPGADRCRLTYGGTVRLYFGRVDYDGQTQAGTPVRTDVDYTGFSLEGNLGSLIKTQASRVFVEPQLKLGINSWTRDIKSTSFAVGYEENWTTVYGRVGLGLVLPFTPDYRLTLSGGATIPIWVQNSVDFPGVDNLDLEPEAFHPTPYAELTFDYKRFSIALFYDSFLFGESDVEYIGPYGFLQPESYTYSFGARVSFAVY